jgi:SAM-dependent methyltransferase
MDRTKLKNYAPKARREFIQAMIDRAAFYGLTADKTEPVVEKGDVVVIGGRSFPIAVARKRKSLEERIKRHGFQQTMEAMAYTWFNRLVAIRYMELRGYLDHGYRVLSHPEGKPTPEILEHAEHVEFPGLKKDRVIDLKLAGNKEGELYRLLLTAQCNALHKAMPFLFERIDDETELLLPDNLLNSDSLIRKLVNEIDEVDWQEVEIIGWLYQFYISERKDEVIGKVVASEDIPAATQLFTPNWIVKYLVQNTLGRQWLATYPDSPLRQQMEYYIEPAEQTPEVQEQLRAITPTSLNPEELTLLDPACGSGHILVEAYDLFKAIYQERGYRAKDIPALILQKNLFGLEIDDRAAQLAAFALMMKARADDRRIFDSEAKPNILAFEDSQGMKASEIHFAITSPLKGEKEGEQESPAPDSHLFEPDDSLSTRAEVKKAEASRTPTTANFSQADIASLLELFENAKTFGSLIQVPPRLAAKLPEIEKRLDDVLTHGDLTHASAHVLKPLLQQARLLAQQYDAVVANPPYMGRKGMNTILAAFMGAYFPSSKYDLYSAFLERGLELLRFPCNFMGMIVMETWMFLPSYEEFRSLLFSKASLSSVVHMPYEGKGRTTMGIAFGTAACVFQNSQHTGAKTHFCFVRHTDLNDEVVPQSFPIVNERLGFVDLDFIHDLPGKPVAYWLKKPLQEMFRHGTSLGEIARPRQGLATSDNTRFLREWHEVDHKRIGWHHESRDAAKAAGSIWIPYSKGGEFRRWYGNNSLVVNWKNDGEDVIGYAAKLYGSPTRTIKNMDFYFRPAVTWSLTCSSEVGFGARWRPGGYIFDVNGMSAFPTIDPFSVLALLNSKVSFVALKVINPTWAFQAGDIAKIPFVGPIPDECSHAARDCVAIAKSDWDSRETSWDFTVSPLLGTAIKAGTLSESFRKWASFCQRQVHDMAKHEQAINRKLLAIYRISELIEPQIDEANINLHRADSVTDTKNLLSYAIGCIMGRYSLDKPGLIYAHSGNQGFDAAQYKSFRADDDGIIPLLETDWGIRDDATNRIVEFIGVAWPKEHLEENLKFIADNLGPTGSEQPRETIRRYLATGFYKHHLSMYKKRPIYWLFSSGKQRAFQCLVYLHRYNEGTLARMRTEYVIPLQGQIAARIDQLEGDKAKATSTSHRTKIQKEQDKLKKQQAELAIFEEKLKHYADMRISLDLDDGVKVNYAKFGDLLAESKAITGGKDEE